MWIRTQIHVQVRYLLNLRPPTWTRSRNKKFSDPVKMIKSLFLNRYGQSVTLNGEKINDENHEETGYGIWLG